MYHVFIQNIFELLFLVGFVWYFKWPPLFVLCCCMVEACALCFFSTLKIKSSTGLFDKIKDKLGWISGITCVILCLLQAVVFFIVNPQENILGVLELFWNDNEFLFCVVAVAIQPYLEYVKYKKTVQLFPSDIEEAFVNPALKLLVQQFVLLVLLLLLMGFSGVPLLVQALLLSVVWTITKTLLGQTQVAFIPIVR